MLFKRSVLYTVCIYYRTEKPARFSTREHWMTRTRLSRSLMIWLLPHPLQPQLQPVSIDQRHTGRLRKRCREGGGEVRRGSGRAKSYDSEKAWSSINHSMPSGCERRRSVKKTTLFCLPWHRLACPHIVIRWSEFNLSALLLSGGSACVDKNLEQWQHESSLGWGLDNPPPPPLA